MHKSRFVVIILVSLACAAAPRSARSVATANTDVAALIADYDRAWIARD
jgi:hypothetical protein